MKTIIRVAAQYGDQVASAMANAARVAKSVDDIYQHAHKIANHWHNAHAAVEVNHQPSNPHPSYYYYSWLWDPRFQCWRIEQWNGSGWCIY